MFEPGEIYDKAAFYTQFGVKPHHRISISADHDMILLFADDLSQQYPYMSGWTCYGIFRFIGEGHSGHMAFTHGNQALRNHRKSGKAVHLFVRADANHPNKIRYEGEVMYRGHFYKEGYDHRNHVRRMIVFVLKPCYVLAEA